MAVSRKAPAAQRDPAADAILSDNFTLYEVTDKVPRKPGGGLDWTYNGPTGDKEWGWGLNRQNWIMTLLSAYSSTGNPEYVKALDKLLRDWLTSNPYPGEKNTTPQWRGLEVFMRVALHWPAAFFGLQEDPEFTPGDAHPDAFEHSQPCALQPEFPFDHGNWIGMELRGLASAAVYWPEFKDANAWFDYATNRMTPELANQVYPDGAQKELTSSYHLVALHSFDEFRKLAEAAGRKLPDAFASCVERMWNYTAYAMNPMGYDPLNNDADLDSVRADVSGAADSFKRPDWTYIASNGAQGTRPEGPPSTVFPWAGQVLMRSNWDAAAQWSFFDVGPMGIGHWHWDKLHLSVAAYGRDILVDGGRFTYQSGPWRSYFVGSASHNVILIDGHNQKIGDKEVKAPMSGNYAITPGYDFARGVFDSGYEGVEGTVTHSRDVLYVRDGYWLVTDRISTDRPHEITALWHFHPSCKVEVNGREAVSVDEGKGNVRITPSSGMAWKQEMVAGREDPALQGWWSERYNIKEPESCVVYTAPITGTVTFAWLIVPGKGNVPQGVVTVAESNNACASVRVEIADRPPKTWRMPFDGNDVTVE